MFWIGPEFVYEALRTDSKCSASAAGRSLKFLANVDEYEQMCDVCTSRPHKVLS